MAKKTVDALVTGGKASAGPPLGPSLGQLKVNVQEVVNQINIRTKDMAGMQVPVKVIVDMDTKKFDIEIGTPPVSALIKKEINIPKGSPKSGIARAGDISMEQVKKVSKIKFGDESKSHLNEVMGTARSMGVTVGKGPLTEEDKKKLVEAAKKEEPVEKPKAAATPAPGKASAK